MKVKKKLTSFKNTKIFLLVKIGKICGYIKLIVIKLNNVENTTKDVT